MTIQEYTAQVKESELSPSVKEEVLTVLSAVNGEELDVDTKQKISLLLQKDIENLIVEQGDEETKKLSSDVDEDAKVQLASVQKEVEVGLAQVESEFAELDQLATELNTTEEQVRIQELKDILSATV